MLVSPRVVVSVVLSLTLMVGAATMPDSSTAHWPVAKAKSAKAKKKRRRICRHGERPRGKRPCLRAPRWMVRPPGRSQQAGPNNLLQYAAGEGLGGGGEVDDRGENAIFWARGFRKDAAYAWRCERFVENAFNETEKFLSAAEAQVKLGVTRTEAPRGSLVYFRPADWNRRLGHVGIALGNGRMISAFNRVVETNYKSDPILSQDYAGWVVAPPDWSGRLALRNAPNPGLEPSPESPGGSQPGPGQAPQQGQAAPEPSVTLTSPSAGSTLTGVVTLTASTENASGVEFDAYYATDPSNANSLGWHKLGEANNVGAARWSMPYDTRAIPDQGDPAWSTVNVMAVALDAAGNPTAARQYQRVDVSNPPPAPKSVAHYNCAGTPNAFGHYVPAGKYWGNDFVAQGRTITGGYLLIGANTGDHDHSARIGIYTGPSRTGALGETTLQVSGYGGASFTFPAPIQVSPGQQLWITASGIGDFTAYDQNNGGADGCFIGRIDGFQ